MPDNFEVAVTYVLGNEGGYVNEPADSGGPTNFGITMATLAKWRGLGVNSDDVEKLTVTEAKMIYRNWYWTDVGFNLVRDPAIAAAIMDQGVLMGPRTAITCAQLAANNCGATLVVDGVLGHKTRAALEQVKVNEFIDAYCVQLKARYDAIVANKPSQKRFYSGWLNRALKLLSLKW